VTKTTRTKRQAWLTTLFAWSALAVMASVALLTAVAAPAHAQEYRFVELVDSARDGFEPFSFGCATINGPGEVAFRAGRPAGDGFNTIPGIYRVNLDGSLTTIVENERRFVQIGFNPSMNDLGQVSFAARVDGRNKPDTESILRGSGKKLTTIASTEDEFNFFGFDTSVSDAGEVAFKAELDEEFGFEEGLFSGNGGDFITHYLASTSDFGGNDSRPSINNHGVIGFDETINFETGVFAGREGEFTTIAAPDPDVFVQKPVLNDAGTAAFYRSFFNEVEQVFVEEIVTGNGGALTTVVDTRGEFGSFGFRPPSLNSAGQVAFQAQMDDFSTSGIFVGPDPIADRVVATGDTLSGRTVQNLTFCEEGLSDGGQLAFVAQLEDADSPEGFRMAVFLATPEP
jgi:hypothetical protein